MDTSSIEAVSLKKHAQNDMDEGEGDTASVATSSTYKGSDIHTFHLYSLVHGHVICHMTAVQVGAEVSTELLRRREELKARLLAWSTGPRKQEGTSSGRGGQIPMHTCH